MISPVPRIDFRDFIRVSERDEKVAVGINFDGISMPPIDVLSDKGYVRRGVGDVEIIERVPEQRRVAGPMIFDDESLELPQWKASERCHVCRAGLNPKQG